jgi:hypothetical protein
MDESTPPPVPPSTPVQESPAPSRKSAKPFWIAAACIFAPGLVALQGSEAAGTGAAFFLAPLGGLGAGILLGTRIGNTSPTKAAWSLFLIPLCFVAAETIAAAGCEFGGFKLNVH